MTGIDVALVSGFLLAMVAAGLGISRWVKGTDDFYVASRQLPPFILAATITASNVNMYSFIGQAGSAYKSGLGIIWHTWVGCMAMVFAGIFVAPMMRRLGLRTVPELVGLRYNRYLRMFISTVWMLKMCFWLAVIVTAATVAAESITGVASPWLWLFVFAGIAIIYTTAGGAWAIATTDTFVFAFMLASALVVLPLAMHAAGWMPNLVANLKAQGLAEHLVFVSRTREFNWLFILSMIFIGVKWACIDQAILQRAFGGRDPRAVAQGMVLAAVITTPFAFLWILPGLAVTQLIPGLERGDQAIPRFLAQYVPAGVLGLVLCGLFGSQLGTISANLNSVATLFTHDLYQHLRPRAASASLLKVARWSTVAAGLVMVLFARYVVSRFEGIVQANLTIVAIFDMPILVIAILYGLFWRRTNWQGAIGGYVAGALGGLTCYFYFKSNPDLGRYALVEWLFGTQVNWAGWAKSLAAMASTISALIATPLVTLCFRRPEVTPAMESVFAAFRSSDDDQAVGAGFPLVPVSLRGKAALGLMLVGFLAFLAGVLSAGPGFSLASQAAIAGMVIYFAGGLLRVYSD